MLETSAMTSRMCFKAANKGGQMVNMQFRYTSCLCAMVLVLKLAAMCQANAQTYTYETLHGFTGYPSDGAFPEAGLFRDAAANLYGTTYYGGSSCRGYGGCGTVFKVDTTGKETVLYSFTGNKNGQFPVSRPVLDSAGNIYATTQVGGSIGFGTVLRLGRSGKKTVLHNFANFPDGAYPTGGLAIDAANNLYGTAWQGGDPNCAYPTSGCGTVYKVNGRTGKTTILYRFAGTTDGLFPIARVILDSAGNLFGTTESGGAHGAGTVFTIDTTGAETTLYSFNGSDGSEPSAALIRDAKGNMYGTTEYGGASGEGTVFELSSDGRESVIYAFTGGVDGGNPVAGLIRGKGGNLFGTTREGGSGYDGTVFMVTESGQETVLYNFPNGEGYPYGGLAEDGFGNLYGTALGGTQSNRGVVFKLSLQ